MSCDELAQQKLPSVFKAGFLLGFFRVVQRHLDCLVHHLDHNSMQLCTTWIQSEVWMAMVQLLLTLCKQGMPHRHQVELCIVVVFVGWMDSLYVKSTMNNYILHCTV